MNENEMKFINGMSNHLEGKAQYEEIHSIADIESGKVILPQYPKKQNNWIDSAMFDVMDDALDETLFKLFGSKYTDTSNHYKVNHINRYFVDSEGQYVYVKELETENKKNKFIFYGYALAKAQDKKGKDIKDFTPVKALPGGCIQQVETLFKNYKVNQTQGVDVVACVFTDGKIDNDKTNHFVQMGEKPNKINKGILKDYVLNHPNTIILVYSVVSTNQYFPLENEDTYLDFKKNQLIPFDLYQHPDYHNYAKEICISQSILNDLTKIYFEQTNY